jgi:hypothetical protein
MLPYHIVRPGAHLQAARRREAFGDARSGGNRCPPGVDAFHREPAGADKESNWLPAPRGPFIGMLRMYGPHETSPSILNGTWKPPVVKRVD